MLTMQQLKALPQWVGHTVKKVPLNPHTGKAAQSNNPETWGTATEAWAAKKKYGWPGISFAFTLESGVVGIDLDRCFDDDDRLSDDAAQIVDMMRSYTERSPSGKGLHILACGSIPHSVKRPGFEMYNELRYFTVTGNQYGASEFVICTICRAVSDSSPASFMHLSRSIPTTPVAMEKTHPIPAQPCFLFAAHAWAAVAQESGLLLAAAPPVFASIGILFDV